MAEQRHLWEVDHPYYCGEATWYKVEDHKRWPSWAAFRDGTIFVTGDRDLNLLFRWDWHSARGTDPWVDEGDPDQLCLYFVLQRKPFMVSHYMPVTDEDEPEVRAFLEACAVALAAIWEPLTLAATPGGTDG